MPTMDRELETFRKTNLQGKSRNYYHFYFMRIYSFMPPFPLLFYFKRNFFAIRISVFCVFHLKNDRQLISSKNVGE